MDMPTPDHQPNAPPPMTAVCSPTHSSRACSRRLPPPCRHDSQAERDENQQAARELFASLNPRDPAEAQLAALAIAAAQSAMDNFTRAARPGVADETAIRLRGSALAAGRTYAAVLRTLRKSPVGAASRHAQADAAKAETGACRCPAATARRATRGPRRVPAPRPVRQADPHLPDRADDAGAVARNPRLAAEPRAGGRGDRRGGGDDRRAGGAWAREQATPDADDAGDGTG